MMKIARIILASHGTPGARAAEDAALALAHEHGAALHHLLVVPDFWKGMMGDDWLNNAVTQIRFGNYVENQLAREAAAESDRLARAAEEKSLAHTFVTKLGKPADCLVAECAHGDFDMAVVGSPRPKGAPGYRSRLALEPLVRALNARLMIIPHPER
jgi:nucleotide-binding universal stress UspA family protein